MNARELSCVAQIVFERSENFLRLQRRNVACFSPCEYKILILCYYESVGVVQLNAPNAAYKTKKQISKPKNRGAHGLKAQLMSS